MIRVLIVDDSAFMRVKIRTLLESDPEIHVVGIARTGMDALQKSLILKPDVITMDINMPDISGIQAVELIMKEYPTPIIMISSLTYNGARETLEALEMGAVDYIHKEQLTEKKLIEKIYTARYADITTIINTPAQTLPHSGKLQNNGHHDFSDSIGLNEANTRLQTMNRDFSVIGIGISTGGPKALSKFLPLVSPDIQSSIVIAQHMPETFTKPLAERLNRESKLTVKEAENGEILHPGCAYICPGNHHVKIEKKGAISLYPKEAYPEYHYCPSADLLMSSISSVYQENALCLIMTGMGTDGLEGIKAARNQRSYVMAQSQNSSTIYGMPKAIISSNLQDEIVHLDQIAERINQLCKKD